METVMIAPVGLLIVVAVIVGLVLLVRALPPGSGPKVALGAGGLLALAMLFIGFVRVSEPRPIPQIVPKTPANFGNFPDANIPPPATSSLSLLPNMLLILVGLVVLVGLVFLIYSLAQSSGGRVALGAGGFVVVLLMFLSFFYFSKSHMAERQVAVRQEQLTQRLSLPPRTIEPNKEPKPLESTPSEGSVDESEPKAITPDTNAEKSNSKPAWLSQGLQTGNGLTQFPVSSELFASVAECRRDLDERMAALIMSEIQRLFGEDAAITLRRGEAQQFIADTYTEENQTSQGTWYKVHQLIKLDETARAMLRTRYQEAQLQARLVSLGIGLGGVLLVLGVVYLILRRPPRVVDPTLNTFSMT